VRKIFRNRAGFHHTILLLTIGLSSCGSRPTPSSPTPILPQPTNTAPATMESEFSPFKVGSRYSDTSGDMAIPFLDVVAFRATVNEEAETLNALLWMRDIPETADRWQVTNLIEYSWTIDVYLDPSVADPADYYLTLNTSVEDPSASGKSLTPILGRPERVPIHQLFENRNIYNSNRQPLETVQVEINPDRNTLLLTGRVPGITSNAVFSFDTTYNEGTTDRPDNYVHPESANLSTPLPELNVPEIDNTTQLVPIGAVRAFPGPEHYAGDILTFGIQAPPSFDESNPIYMALDDRKPTQALETFWFGEVIVPSALDTTTLVGHHTIQFTTKNSDLNETYSFDVLPADQRPVNEMRADWLIKEIDCCIFHYLSDTAAARDIDFISEHFQQGADAYEAIMKTEIDSKMEIHIIDRIFRNGGFGGHGNIVISYTDRYYGPTVGGEGLETLARHEFSHAASISPENSAGTVDFNYEGLAVYVAGGHYKPEPLAQRGAALSDLGFSVPVNELIPQHELSYLHAALILTYIVDTYGEEKLWTFLSADQNRSDGQLLPVEDAIRLTFEISLEEFDHGFQAWLESNDPGKQLDDLRLTVALQDARREYQDRYSPDPLFLTSELDTSVIRRSEYLPVVMREARAPTNIAIELIIANAQQAIFSGDYASAEALNKVIAEIISTGEFEDPLAKDYLDIVLAAGSQGYEVVNMDILLGDHASARATAEPPLLVNLEFQKIDGIWQIQP
jgi:hypothetical protein